MKLLLDENLSWRLVKLILNDFPESKHISNVGPFKKDAEIWEYARKNHYLVLTNDEDFLNLLLQKGFPPKIILIKTGNQSTQYIANKLIHLKAEIYSFYQNEDLGLLEIY